MDPDHDPIPLHARIRWATVGPVLALVAATALVVLWPRMAPPAPDVPSAVPEAVVDARAERADADPPVAPDSDAARYPAAPTDPADPAARAARADPGPDPDVVPLAPDGADTADATSVEPRDPPRRSRPRRRERPRRPRAVERPATPPAPAPAQPRAPAPRPAPAPVPSEPPGEFFP